MCIANKLIHWQLFRAIALITLTTFTVSSDLYKPAQIPGNLDNLDQTSTLQPHNFNAEIIDEIKAEALAPNDDSNHPLPLLASWNASTWWNYNTKSAGFYPGWQFEWIDQGHHIFPWFNIPTPEDLCPPNDFCYQAGYLEAPIRKAAQYNLPISFVGTEWEHYLYSDPSYYNLPPDQNPNVVSPDGVTQKTISPFGSVDIWYEVGRKWGSSQLMQQVISWYPNPPMVLFVSNNEANKLSWVDAEKDKHYIDLYGYGRDDDFKRRVFVSAWGECYQMLLQGFRDGLSNSNWQAVSRFIGYQAFGPGWFGSWPYWKNYSFYVLNQIDPAPLFWQGGSSSMYICPYQCNEWDNNVSGPLFQSMNWVFMLKEAYQLNPSFWYELSSWDGDKKSRNLLPPITPKRYEGFVQYGMWLTRPRIIRVYRDYDESRNKAERWLARAASAVDRIYSDAILESFWRNSVLVANPTTPHPYQFDIPSEYAGINRMFLLNTNLNPPQPWSSKTKFTVLSLARRRGTSPNRQWLLYAYAPLGKKKNVLIAIPDYGNVKIDIAVEGSFYLIDELTQTVKQVRAK